MTRDEIQNNATGLIDITGRLVLKWATSIGKSKAAINIINSLCDKCFKDSQEELSVLLVVNERAHILNWQKEFKKFPIKTSSIKICCYASLKKYISYYNLVILDEAHNVASDLRLSYLKQIRFDNILLLSATITKNIIYDIQGVTGNIPFTINNINLQEAIDNNILSEPHIFLIPLVLDNTVVNQSTIIKWGSGKNIIKCSYGERWRYLTKKDLYPNSKLILSGTEWDKYNQITTECNYLSRQSRFRIKYLRRCLERKLYLGHLKTNIAKRFITNYRDKGIISKYICFCTSRLQAKELSEGTSIYSGKDSSMSLINDFNEGRINSLYAVNMLREGQNLNGIKDEIIIQLDGSEGPFIQKFGRVMRADSPNLYIFYYKNTRDEEYLNKDIENIDKAYIQYINKV